MTFPLQKDDGQAPLTSCYLRGGSLESRTLLGFSFPLSVTWHLSRVHAA